MHRQTNTNEPYPGHLWYEAKRNEKQDKPQLMQWMEANTAAVWVVYRVGNQVIDIDEHRNDHQEVGQLPVFPKEKTSEYGWRYKVQG